MASASPAGTLNGLGRLGSPRGGCYGQSLNKPFNPRAFRLQPGANLQTTRSVALMSLLSLASLR
jgi:hypothetical protein